MKKLLLNIQKFAGFKSNIEDLIKKHSDKDGNIDYAKINETQDADILKYVSKNQPKVDEFKKEARELVIKDLGIESVTNESQLKAHIASLSSDESKQDLIKAQARVTELETNYKDIDSKYQVANTELDGFKREKIVIGKGAKADDAEFHTFKINKLVTDDLDFEKATEKYVKDNPEAFTTQIVKRTTTGTPRYNRGNEPTSENEYDRKMRELGYGDEKKGD